VELSAGRCGAMSSGCMDPFGIQWMVNITQTAG
jgi:uncharacterized glyoxalase superfamily protein PhnB